MSSALQLNGVAVPDFVVNMMLVTLAAAGLKGGCSRAEATSVINLVTDSAARVAAKEWLVRETKIKQCQSSYAADLYINGEIA